MEMITLLSVAAVIITTIPDAAVAIRSFMRMMHITWTDTIIVATATTMKLTKAALFMTTATNLNPYFTVTASATSA